MTAALADDVSITGGLLYLPFGVFETNMISDPLTLDLGEKRDPAVVVEGSADELQRRGLCLSAGYRRRAR